MHPLIDKLFPRNKSQRVGVFVAVTLSILVLLVHNPLDGYDYFMGWDYYFASGGDSWFWKMQSKSPIVDWFGPLSHLASAIASIWVLCATWLYLFRSE